MVQQHDLAFLVFYTTCMMRACVEGFTSLFFFPNKRRFNYRRGEEWLDGCFLAVKQGKHRGECGKWGKRKPFVW